MLKNNLKKHIEENGNTISLFKEEINFIQKYELNLGSIDLNEKEEGTRFADAYIERCDKESENVLAEETASFLNQSIQYLQKNKNEFIYLESPWFELLDVDAVSLEVDDVFGTYDVMLGLKLQKKFEGQLKMQLNHLLNGEGAKFDLMFDANEGFWNLNFTLNYASDFNEDMTIGEAYQLIHRLLFAVVEGLEG
ncbi:branched-chain amino acid aminotransferase [Bacillus sp. 31A1R]|uniref:Branched-chain amino acid aminotransferase n=1 Tax=Robertmurraya mangrovi TaxID=3098077 RepID=A0ABU5J3B2_9BACI|nr:branched-chain amino acid aminotransferase [Bacillus sp. 31A1R]MDZ5473909.1 branched-chain amino acid aminotransferase [Bacillus sp. 31A1R]